MSEESFEKLLNLTSVDISQVIQLAWEDDTSFETIQHRFGLSESDVARLMRSELNPSAYTLWCLRVRDR